MASSPAGSSSRWWFLPDRLDVRGTIDSDLRRRGIFSVPVYALDSVLEGEFVRPDFESGIEPLHVGWDRAHLAIGISDARAIQRETSVCWNTEEIRFLPGDGGFAEAGRRHSRSGAVGRGHRALPVLLAARPQWQRRALLHAVRAEHFSRDRVRLWRSEFPGQLASDRAHGGEGSFPRRRPPRWAGTIPRPGRPDAEARRHLRLALRRRTGRSGGSLSNGGAKREVRRTVHPAHLRYGVAGRDSVGSPDASDPVPHARRGALRLLPARAVAFRASRLPGLLWVGELRGHRDGRSVLQVARRHASRAAIVGTGVAVLCTSTFC